jgi:hypothetical protein
VIHCVCAERRRSASLRTRRRACNDSRRAVRWEAKVSFGSSGARAGVQGHVVDVKDARVRIGSNASVALVATTLKALRP